MAAAAFIGRERKPSLCAARTEEILDHGQAFVGEDAGSDEAAVVEFGHLEEIHEPAGATAFGIGASEDDSPQPGMDNGSGAHWAGFLGDIQLAVGESPIADGSLGLSDGKNFGVRSGVLELFHLIVGARDHTPFEDHNRADRNFFLLPSPPRHAQSLAHEEFVAL